MHDPAPLDSSHAKGMRSHLFAEGWKPGATEEAGQRNVALPMVFTRPALCYRMLWLGPVPLSAGRP